MVQTDTQRVTAETIALSFPETISSFITQESERNPSPILDMIRGMFLEEGLLSDQEKEAPITLADCITYTLHVYQPGDAKVNTSHRNTLYQRRKLKKDYRLRLIKKEYEKGGGGLLEKSYEAYLDYSKYNRVETTHYSKEKFIEDKYLTSIEWAKYDKNLIEYPFYRTLSRKTQAEFLMDDIAFHTYDIIRTKYDRDVSSAVGKFPKAMTEGQFSIFSGSDELKFATDSEENTVAAYTEHVVDNKRLVTTVGSVEVPASARTEEKKLEIINQMLKDNALAPFAKRLDADDQELYTVIYNMFPVDDTGPITINTAELAKKIGKTGRETDCRHVLETMHKLSTYNLQHLEIDNTSIKFSDASLFNVEYELKHPFDVSKEDKIKYDKYSLASGSTRKSIVDVIEEFNENIPDDSMKYRYSAVSISIEPSAVTRRELRDNLNQIWLLSTYENDLSNRTKVMLRMLLARRLDLHKKEGNNGELEDTLHYTYFQEHLNIEKNIRKAKLESLLKKNLDVLTGDNKLLKHYELDKRTKYVKLTFNAFSESEKKLYRMEDDA